MIESLYKVCLQTGCTQKNKPNQCMLCFTCAGHGSHCAVPAIEAEHERLVNLSVALESELATIQHFMMVEYRMSADDLETNAMSAANLEVLS